MTRVLVVDDQRGVRRSLCLLLQNAGFDIGEAASGEAALLEMDDAVYDVVIADLRLGEMSGIDLLRQIGRRDVNLPIIIITAFGTIESAVEAMRLGAFDYLTKPFKEADIVEKIHASQALRSALASRSAPGSEGFTADADIVARSPQMSAILIKTDRLAQTDISVLLTGETGTGKTKIAHLIHERSNRSKRPFVSINCASLPEQLLESELFGHVRGSFTGATDSRVGLFEEATGGTIFLDEIDTLPFTLQAKLLHVLQDLHIRRVGSNKMRSIDVRVICASNQDPALLMEKEAFRSDLYFRISGIRLHLPPLRERGNDIPLLMESFLHKYAARYKKRDMKISPDAMDRILGYSYPGNIRQLESFVEQMVVFANDQGVIDAEALPEELVHPARQVTRSATADFSDEILTVADAERELIESTVKRFRRLEDAARELGIGRTTLWRKMRQYGIGTSRR